MKKNICWIIVLVIFFTACSPNPSEGTIQTAIAQTQAAQSTNTPTIVPATETPMPLPTITPINLLEIDLESILLVEGDLPPNYIGSVITDEFSDTKYWNYLQDRNVPKPDRIINFKIGLADAEAPGYSLNNVVIILYNDYAKRDITYENLIDVSEFVSDEGTVIEADNIGEIATVATEPGTFYGYREQSVVFTRCSAVVYMRTIADTENYAKRLDNRLSELICP